MTEEQMFVPFSNISQRRSLSTVLFRRNNAEGRELRDTRHVDNTSPARGLIPRRWGQ